MSGSLVADLGLGPETWLVVSFLASLTLFFKFSRVWSVRNLDLLLLFALTPGMMVLVGNRSPHPWIAFVLLFVGSLLWFARCVLDLGLTRRPLLEPNLNAAGLACLSLGVLGLLLVETVSLPIKEGAARNPADPSRKPGKTGEPAPTLPEEAKSTVGVILKHTPLPESLAKDSRPHQILARALAVLAHIGLVVALVAVGWRHYDRPISGLAVAASYLISPYTRIALVDPGQVLPAALIVTAILVYKSPIAASVLIGLAAGWMPACVGLIPLWAGFYRGRGGWRFLGVAFLTLVICVALGQMVPMVAEWARALGARSLAEAGLVPSAIAPPSGSFWADIDVSYRLPVLIAYLALVTLSSVWPTEKNLGELIALSAALLVASQFWYIDEGGTLVLLYLPILLLMMFRPNLAHRRPITLPISAKLVQQPLSSVR